MASLDERQSPQPAFWFCATGKSGLGHLRRVSNIAAELHRRRRDAPLVLLSNAGVAGIRAEEQALFARTHIRERADMGDYLARMASGVVTVDTAVLPGLWRAQAPLCLILRETVPERLDELALERGRPWDLLLVPNPAGHWLPPPGRVPARRVEAVGWIYRSLGVPSDPQSVLGARCNDRPRLLIASGGGGNEQTAKAYRARVAELLYRVRQKLDARLEIIQAVGPRADAQAVLDAVDRTVDPGGALNRAFSEADMVVSTVGYNSVLELAGLEVPTVLVPIQRSLDDQLQRARQWADRLGACLEADNLDSVAQWMADTLVRGERRAPVALGTSGANAAAAAIASLW